MTPDEQYLQMQKHRKFLREGPRSGENFSDHKYLSQRQKPENPFARTAAQMFGARGIPRDADGKIATILVADAPQDDQVVEERRHLGEHLGALHEEIAEQSSTEPMHRWTLGEIDDELNWEPPRHQQDVEEHQCVIGDQTKSLNLNEKYNCKEFLPKNYKNMTAKELKKHGEGIVRQLFDRVMDGPIQEEASQNFENKGTATPHKYPPMYVINLPGAHGVPRDADIQTPYHLWPESTRKQIEEYQKKCAERDSQQPMSPGELSQPEQQESSIRSVWLCEESLLPVRCSRVLTVKEQRRDQEDHRMAREMFDKAVGNPIQEEEQKATSQQAMDKETTTPQNLPAAPGAPLKQKDHSKILAARNFFEARKRKAMQLYYETNIAQDGESAHLNSQQKMKLSDDLVDWKKQRDIAYQNVVFGGMGKSEIEKIQKLKKKSDLVKLGEDYKECPDLSQCLEIKNLEQALAEMEEKHRETQSELKTSEEQLQSVLIQLRASQTQESIIATLQVHLRQVTEDLEALKMENSQKFEDLEQKIEELEAPEAQEEPEDQEKEAEPEFSAETDKSEHLKDLLEALKGSQDRKKGAESEVAQKLQWELDEANRKYWNMKEFLEQKLNEKDRQIWENERMMEESLRTDDKLRKQHAATVSNLKLKIEMQQKEIRMLVDKEKVGNGKIWLNRPLGKY